MENEFYKLDIIADFFNTHDRRMCFEDDPGIEKLQTPEDLYNWLIQHHLISEDDAVTMEDLELAIKLRTEARKIIVNNLYDDKEIQFDLTNSFMFTINIFENSEELQPIHKKGLGKLMVMIYELKKKELWHRIRICSAHDCQWVFVDHSRPGTGKWCSMKACGNRAKNKTYRHRRNL
jgi:hypothetical protein